jgi:hypothetical protein
MDLCQQFQKQDFALNGYGFLQFKFGLVFSVEQNPKNSYHAIAAIVGCVYSNAFLANKKKKVNIKCQ